MLDAWEMGGMRRAGTWCPEECALELDSNSAEIKVWSKTLFSVCGWSQDKRVFVQAALSCLASSSGCLFLLFQRRARTMAI